MAEIYPDVSPTNILRATNGSEEKNVEAPVAYRGPASLRWDDFENIGKNLQKGEDSVDDRIEYQYNRQEIRFASGIKTARSIVIITITLAA